MSDPNSAGYDPHDSEVPEQASVEVTLDTVASDLTEADAAVTDITTLNEDPGVGAPTGGAGAAPVISDRGSLARRLTRASALDLVTSLLAIIALGLLLAGAWSVFVFVFAAASLIASFDFPRRRKNLFRGLGPTGSLLQSRTVLAMLVPALHPGAGWIEWVAGVILAMLVVFERSISRIARGAIPYAANLPGIVTRDRGRMRSGRIFVIDTVAILVIGILYAFGAPTWIGLVLAIAAAVPAFIVAIDGIQRVRGRRIAERGVHAALTEFAPQFVLHWDAPVGTYYQVGMWLPYLERLEVPFIVVIRNPATYHTVKNMTTMPVLLRREPRDLDAVVVPGMKVAFYVNNAMRNTHMVRYRQLKHVQLNHGESDKAPSFSPVFRMFDNDFVAGQAAIDRFKSNGVDVHDDLFTIVGRPQLEDVEVRQPGDPVNTILYAPTWGGHNADSNYASLPIGEAMIAALLERGKTVIYRPHPYTGRNRSHRAASLRIIAMLAEHAERTGTPHVFGRAATRERTITECFNEADALISDVSSIVPDFLFSGKPIAMCAMVGEIDEFRANFPISAGVYVIDREATNLEPMLDELLVTDSQAQARQDIKEYFLGPFPAETYVEGFLAAAGRYIRDAPAAPDEVDPAD